MPWAATGNAYTNLNSVELCISSMKFYSMGTLSRILVKCVRSCCLVFLALPGHCYNKGINYSRYIFWKQVLFRQSFKNVATLEIDLVDIIEIETNLQIFKGKPSLYNTRQVLLLIMCMQVFL